MKKISAKYSTFILFQKKIYTRNWIKLMVIKIAPWFSESISRSKIAPWFSESISRSVVSNSLRPHGL